MTSEIVNVSQDCEIITIRTVSFSRDLVFEAWTDPDHLKNWWGPAGFTNTFMQFDLRPGGKWSFIMHGPNNDNYPNECVFIKIDKPRLIAWNHLSNPVFQIVTSFEELTNDRTKITFKMLFNNPELCQKVKTYAVDKNEENMDKLENELSKMVL